MEALANNCLRVSANWIERRSHRHIACPLIPAQLVEGDHELLAIRLLADKPNGEDWLIHAWRNAV